LCRANEPKTRFYHCFRDTHTHARARYPHRLLQLILSLYQASCSELATQVVGGKVEANVIQVLKHQHQQHSSEGDWAQAAANLHSRSVSLPSASAIHTIKHIQVQQVAIRAQLVLATLVANLVAGLLLVVKDLDRVLVEAPALERQVRHRVLVVRQAPRSLDHVGVVLLEVLVADAWLAEIVHRLGVHAKRLDHVQCAVHCHGGAQRVACHLQRRTRIRLVQQEERILDLALNRQVRVVEALVHLAATAPSVVLLDGVDIIDPVLCRATNSYHHGSCAIQSRRNLKPNQIESKLQNSLLYKRFSLSLSPSLSLCVCVCVGGLWNVS
jgi:hypothetical protein